MRVLNRLEQKIGHLAVPHLTLVLIAGQVMFYLATRTNPQLVELMAFDVAAVLRGEWWRPISFLVMPSTGNVLFFFFEMYLLWLMGTALENHWGAFRFNLYLLIGWLSSIGFALASAPLGGGVATNIYLYASIFLAFAYLYPDFELLLFLLLPVKVKWLALITWGFFAAAVLMGGVLTALLIAASLLNFFLFFGKSIVQNARAGYHRMNRQKAELPEEREAMHRCKTCGLTEFDDPEAEFRYCPECTGTPCYCLTHMREHEHE